jgi:hypothetical protein
LKESPVLLAERDRGVMEGRGEEETGEGDLETEFFSIAKIFFPVILTVVT